MRPLTLGAPGDTLTVLALGAHCDDVEIGAGGTLLRLAEEVGGLRAHVVVLSSTADRAAEAQASARAFLAPAELDVTVHGLVDGRFPAQWGEVKSLLDELARAVSPDVVLAPHPRDAHQDHRVLGELVTTSFRDHLVLRYEIPKWDGDLGASRPTHYVPLDEPTARRKCELLRKHFPSQWGRDWFSDETFLGLARLRGMECRAPYAEAFSIDKALLSFTGSGTGTSTTSRRSRTTGV